MIRDRRLSSSLLGVTRLDSLSAAARAQLGRAVKGRDAAAIAALRSLLAALDNAGAQPAGVTTAAATSARIAGATEGLGSAEVERRPLDDATVDALLAAEIAAREDQARVFDDAGRDREATMATYQAKLLRRLQDAVCAGFPVPNPAQTAT
jgi:uncharacterized protein YqeY